MRKFVTALGLIQRRFLQGDRQAGFQLLERVGRLLYPDYRFCDPRLDWWADPAFNAYLERFDERASLNTERKWAVHQLLRLTRAVNGDTAECGVFRGATSYLICAANRGTEKQHHVFDSFAGLSEPGSDDGAYWKAGDLEVDEETVRRNLAEFSAVRLYRGWIPERFAEVQDRTFSFVHVDVDLRQPTEDSVRFFYPRLETGGILVVDDYGFATCPGATEAVDRFLEDREERMLALPAGGGFMIRGAPTAKPGL